MVMEKDSVATTLDMPRILSGRDLSLIVRHALDCVRSPEEWIIVEKHYGLYWKSYDNHEF